MPSNMIWLASIMTLARVVASQNILFFYTDTVDLCQYDNVGMQADNQTMNGGVCAYKNDVERVYACPAPDPNCWTWAQDCTSSGIGQTVCNRGGTVFCCNAVAGESCTTSADQINICISNFSSPNSGVPVSKANSVYLAAISASTVTATTQTVQPSPFTTEQLAVTVTTSSSSTIRISLSSSTGSAAAQSTSSNAVAASSSSSSSGISGGAIAGIVIGVIAALAIAGVIAFFVLRKKRSTAQSQTQPRPLTSELQSPPPPFSAIGGTEKKYNDFYEPGTATSELGSEDHGRVEMPGNGHDAQHATRYEMA